MFQIEISILQQISLKWTYRFNRTEISYVFIASIFIKTEVNRNHKINKIFCFGIFSLSVCVCVHLLQITIEGEDWLFVVYECSCARISIINDCHHVMVLYLSTNRTMALDDIKFQWKSQYSSSLNAPILLAVSISKTKTHCI